MFHLGTTHNMCNTIYTIFRSISYTERGGGRRGLAEHGLSCVLKIYACASCGCQQGSRNVTVASLE
jgi:hypothetical protein